MDFRASLRKKVPRLYHGYVHMAFTTVISLGSAAYLFARVEHATPLEWLALPGILVLASLLEYAEHRFVLHREVPGGAFAYKIHTLEHHRFFTDTEFLPKDHRDLFFVLFPLKLAFGYVFVTVFPVAWLVGWLATPNAGAMAGAGSALFFFLYEVIHFSSHLGWNSWIARHHRLHHDRKLMGVANFNVVLPVFDWMFGTLRRKA